jgi:hypothetical protein
MDKMKPCMCKMKLIMGKMKPNIVAEIFHFGYFGCVFHWRSSSFKNKFNFGFVPSAESIEFKENLIKWLLRYSTFTEG